MGKIHTDYLNGPVIWSCAVCETHLANDQALVSKSFRGETGEAYLFNKCFNLQNGKTQTEKLITGLHVITYVHCKGCLQRTGWIYKAASEPSESYKIGMTVLEKSYLCKRSADTNSPIPQESVRLRITSLFSSPFLPSSLEFLQSLLLGSSFSADIDTDDEEDDENEDSFEPRDEQDEDHHEDDQRIDLEDSQNEIGLEENQNSPSNYITLHSFSLRHHPHSPSSHSNQSNNENDDEDL